VENILAKLKQIQENPGYFKGLTPEDQAELFLALLTPKKKILRKPVVITGIDGKTPEKDKDYLSKESSLAILNEIKDEVQKTLKAIKPEKGTDGKDAQITPELIERIVTEAVDRVPLPVFPYETIKTISDTQDTLLNVTEDILDIKEDVEKLKNEPKVVYQQGGTIGKQQVYGFIKQAVIDGVLSNGTGSIADTYETINQNLSATNAVFNYTGDKITSIDYGDITKTIAYSGDTLVSITLSGNTPDGIDLIKTFTYSGDTVTGYTYS
jgi:hypothetical protein